MQANSASRQLLGADLLLVPLVSVLITILSLPTYWISAQHLKGGTLNDWPSLCSYGCPIFFFSNVADTLNDAKSGTRWIIDVKFCFGVAA